MFLILNKTKKNLSFKINKKHVSLGPHKAIDIDNMFNRDDIESSEGLKALLINNCIEIRKSKKEQLSDLLRVDNDDKVDNIFEEKLDSIKSSIDRNSNSINDSVVNELMLAIKNLSNEISELKEKTGQVTVIEKKIEQKTPEKENFPSISDKKLEDLQKRFTEKLVKDTRGEISIEDEDTNDSIGDIANDIMNL